MRVLARVMRTFRQRFDGLAACSQDCFQVIAVGAPAFGAGWRDVFVMTKLASRGQKNTGCDRREHHGGAFTSPLHHG